MSQLGVEPPTAPHFSTCTTLEAPKEVAPSQLGSARLICLDSAPTL